MFASRVFRNYSGPVSRLASDASQFRPVVTCTARYEREQREQHMKQFNQSPAPKSSVPLPPTASPLTVGDTVVASRFLSGPFFILFTRPSRHSGRKFETRSSRRPRLGAGKLIDSQPTTFVLWPLEGYRHLSRHIHVLLWDDGTTHELRRLRTMSVAVAHVSSESRIEDVARVTSARRLIRWTATFQRFRLERRGFFMQASTDGGMTPAAWPLNSREVQRTTSSETFSEGFECFALLIRRPHKTPYLR